MRRLAILPLLAVGLLAGCAQAADIAGDALGVPVDEICTTADAAYAQYQAILEQGDVTAEQADVARDDLVATLERLADDVGGQPGELIRANAEQLSQVSDLTAPETVEAVEQAKGALTTLCG
ncbi:hypothetical protein [Microbacterium sp. JZ37]|uniref:hypothetical protein n=1 Tax=Microbacterium sp. JZ37 TaxID=2654193 RepID=UPI002B475F64|nr:hypothetical protein [Microbacterium sp. JZ37]WRH16281.1 hypothetical protein GC092_01270 [Microbacterium sp. JZ37]